MLAPSHGATTR